MTREELAWKLQAALDLFHDIRTKDPEVWKAVAAAFSAQGRVPPEAAAALNLDGEVVVDKQMMWAVVDVDYEFALAYFHDVEEAFAFRNNKVRKEGFMPEQVFVVRAAVLSVNEKERRTHSKKLAFMPSVFTEQVRK